MNKFESTLFAAIAISIAAVPLASISAQAYTSGSVVEVEPVLANGFDYVVNDNSRLLKARKKKSKDKGKGKSGKSQNGTKKNKSTKDSKDSNSSKGKKKKNKGKGKKGKSKGKGKGKGKGKKGKGTGKNNSPASDGIPTDEQTCALFAFFSPLATGECPTSDFFCPTVTRRNRNRGRMLKGKGKGKSGKNGSSNGGGNGSLGDSVVCIDSFEDFCEEEFDCAGGNDDCVDVIQRCCTGWCDSDLTLDERADFFEIVADDPTGSNCDVYSDVLCPDENQIDYVCTDMTTFENFCNTYTDFNNATFGADCQASMNCCCP